MNPENDPSPKSELTPEEQRSISGITDPEIAETIARDTRETEEYLQQKLREIDAWKKSPTSSEWIQELIQTEQEGYDRRRGNLDVEEVEKTTELETASLPLKALRERIDQLHLEGIEFSAELAGLYERQQQGLNPEEQHRRLFLETKLERLKLKAISLHHQIAKRERDASIHQGPIVEI